MAKNVLGGIGGGAGTGAAIGGAFGGFGAPIGAAIGGGLGLLSGLFGGGPPEDTTPMPTMKDYEGIRNADGTLKDPYKVATDNSGMQALKDRANATGMSPWAQMALSKQGAEQTQAMNDVNARTAGAGAEAMGNLAMRGGLSSGSRDNLARASMNSQLGAQQDVSNQGQMQRYNIGLQDQMFKQGAQDKLAGYDQQANLYNANQAASDQANANNYYLNQYGQQMSAWAANKAANAEARSGKK